MGEENILQRLYSSVAHLSNRTEKNVPRCTKVRLVQCGTLFSVLRVVARILTNTSFSALSLVAMIHHPGQRRFQSSTRICDIKLSRESKE